MTWEQLVELEPRLDALLSRARSVKDDPLKSAFCANAVWYGYGSYWGQGLKGAMLDLVGWGRPSKHPVLSSEEAYNLAYDTLYEVLPNCRNCLCVDHLIFQPSMR